MQREKLSSGEKLLSVRELALMKKVNPNTMQKALQELENIGLIYTERTNGKYVTKDISIIKKTKQEFINNITSNFLKDMNNIGLTTPEIIKYLQELERNGK